MRVSLFLEIHLLHALCLILLHLAPIVYTSLLNVDLIIWTVFHCFSDHLVAPGGFHELISQITPGLLKTSNEDIEEVSSQINDTCNGHIQVGLERNEFDSDTLRIDLLRVTIMTSLSTVCLSTIPVA